VVLLLVPVFCVACLAGRASPLRALWVILSGLKGTDIEVGHGNASLSIDIF